MKRIPISKKTRFDVLERDDFTCQYCGRMAPEVALEVDHIVPVSRGGTNNIDNLITSCRDCNRGKGKRSLEEIKVEFLVDADVYDFIISEAHDFEISVSDYLHDVVCGYVHFCRKRYGE